MANALFLRGFDREILEEMRGIADGASDAGAKWLNHRQNHRRRSRHHPKK